MKRFAVAAVLLLWPIFNGCETTSYKPPAVTAVMARGSANQQKLTEGRALFVSRCIDCHSLPPGTKYSAEEWPALVAKMSGRAHLQADQQESVIAYILAARSTSH
jgi:mono/diheme cytochrome c family protein